MTKRSPPSAGITRNPLLERVLPCDQRPGRVLRSFLPGVVGGTIIAACAALQQGTEAACTFVDSKNPEVGALCLTLEELESVFGHVKATRALKAHHASLTYGKKLDVCAAPIMASLDDERDAGP